MSSANIEREYIVVLSVNTGVLCGFSSDIIYIVFFLFEFFLCNGMKCLDCLLFGAILGFIMKYFSRRRKKIARTPYYIRNILLTSTHLRVISKEKPISKLIVINRRYFPPQNLHNNFHSRLMQMSFSCVDERDFVSETYKFIRRQRPLSSRREIRSKRPL